MLSQLQISAIKGVMNSPTGHTSCRTRRAATTARAAHVAVEQGSGQPLSNSLLQVELLPEQQQEFERLLETPLPEVMAEAAALRDQGHRCITFSPKVS